MRNHVLVVPTVICSSVVAERIAAAIAPVGTALPHTAGCGQLGPDLRVTHDTLAAYCQHPNVGAVHRASRSAASRWSRSIWPTPRIAAGKPAEIVAIQRKAAPFARPIAASGIARAHGRGSGAVEARAVRRVVADALGQMRRIGLHLGPRVESGRSAASPIASSISAAASSSARSPRSWARSICSPSARPRRRLRRG